MGNYENIVKTEEIRKKVEEGDLLAAQKILDTMELKKLKNMSDLNLLAEVYMLNERYDKSAELYLKIYDKSKTRKTISQLVNIYIKKCSVDDAENYLKQYQKTSPEDFDGSVFRYKIDKLKGVSYEQLIASLETLKKIEYTEVWAYELAKLYYKAGMELECIKECSDIVLWFGEGIYVEKAKMLRSYYSGETGKEKILEELKRRSEQVKDNASVEVPSVADNARDSEESIYSGSDFMKESDEEEFEVGLKKNIQDMLIDEDPHDEFTEKQEETSRIQQGKLHSEEQGKLYSEEQEELCSEEQGKLHSEEQEELYSEEQEKLYSEEQEELYSEEQEKLYYEEGEQTDLETLEEVNDAFTEETSSEEVAASGEHYFAEENNEIKQASREISYEQQAEELDEDDIKLYNIAEELNIDFEEVFGNFLHVVSVKKQIVKSLEYILQDNKSVLMVITGNDGAGKTTLAKDMALFLSQIGRLKSSKVAKISADKLNSVDLEAKRETLKSCCLVVENASELKRSTIEKLLELTKQVQGDIAIIFEENKKNMNKLFRECPKLMDLLKIRIHLPQYTQEDLIGFAYASLKQKDYKLNAKAEAALKNKMNLIAIQSKPHTYLEQIYNLMQCAMNSADLRTGKQLTNLATQGRLKDVEILLILPEDLKS